MEKEKNKDQKVKNEKQTTSKKATTKEKIPNTTNKQYPATKPRQPKKEVKKESEVVSQTKKKTAKKEKKLSASDEYIQKTMAQRKKLIRISIAAVILIIVGLFLSTGFAIANMTNSKIISGISIDNIDVSGMTEEEALKLLEDKLLERQTTVVKFDYATYGKELSYEQLEVVADVEGAVKEAIQYGRSKGIFANNIDIIKSKFQKRNIDIEVSLNEEKLNQFLSDTSVELPGAVQQYNYSVEDQDKELVITSGIDGIIIDHAQMKSDIINELQDFSKKITAEREIQVIDVTAKPIDIEAIYKEVYSEPQDAYIVDEPFQVVVDKDGIDFAISIDEAKEMLKEKKSEYIIPLKISKASITVADLGPKAFPDLLATFTTRYNAGNINRSTNLAVACSKINNYVVQPGDTFSYNQALGKRSIENGFREAHIFTSTGVEDGMGGGICQISTTLYNSVLYANLEIVERHNHAYDPEYVDLGRDATVSYGSLDFRFKNPRKYPIKITAYINAGVATVNIYGIKEENEPTVTLSSTETPIPFQTETIEDDTLPEGEEVVEKEGLAGGRSVAYKTVRYADGTISTETLSSDTYRAITKVVRVGTKKVAKPTHTHKYGVWVTTKEPTITEDGIQERTCSCGKKETKTLPKLTPEQEPEIPEEQDTSIP